MPSYICLYGFLKSYGVVINQISTNLHSPQNLIKKEYKPSLRKNIKLLKFLKAKPSSQGKKLFQSKHYVLKICLINSENALNLLFGFQNDVS